MKKIILIILMGLILGCGTTLSPKHIRTTVRPDIADQMSPEEIKYNEALAQHRAEIVKELDKALNEAGVSKDENMWKDIVKAGATSLVLYSIFLIIPI